MATTDRDFTKALVYRDPSMAPTTWVAWVPPTRPEHYDVPAGSTFADFDRNEASILGPYGDSYWHTWEEAKDLVLQALVTGSRVCPLCGHAKFRPFDDGFIVCGGCSEILSPSELVANATAAVYRAGLETIAAPAEDWWVCVCGNTTGTGGFTPSTATGRIVDPGTEDWTSHLLCPACGRVMDQATRTDDDAPRVTVVHRLTPAELDLELAALR